MTSPYEQCPHCFWCEKEFSLGDYNENSPEDGGYCSWACWEMQIYLARAERDKDHKAIGILLEKQIMDRKVVKQNVSNPAP